MTKLHKRGEFIVFDRTTRYLALCGVAAKLWPYTRPRWVDVTCKRCLASAPMTTDREAQAQALVANSERIKLDSEERAWVSDFYETLPDVEALCHGALGLALLVVDAKAALALAKEAERRVSSAAHKLTTKLDNGDLSCVWCEMRSCEEMQTMKLCHGENCPLVFIGNDMYLAVNAALDAINEAMA